MARVTSYEEFEKGMEDFCRALLDNANLFYGLVRQDATQLTITLNMNPDEVLNMDVYINKLV